MPLVLTVKEMARVFGVGRRKAYALLNGPGFSKVKIGNSYKVYRDGLRLYMEKQIKIGGASVKKWSLFL